MREHHAGDPGRVLRFVPGQPAQLGDGERGVGHAAGLLRPPPRAALGDQCRGVVGGPQVIPEQGGPDHLARLVDHDHSVLLAGDRDRIGPCQQAGARLLQRRPPRGRVAFRATRVRRAAAADHRPVRRLAQHDLGGLGRGIHARHEHRGHLLW
jgi:hypothetical protein